MTTLKKAGRPQYRLLLNTSVMVAALGYFVDIYDLILFSIVRVPSLRSLGYDGEPLFEKGILLLNMQMAGMLIGGIFWGILGDKRGRLSVLFGSIILYSLANIANATAQTVWVYAVLRFIAGVGLAGELGAGITLVSEVLSKELRGYGTTIVATVGVCGALLAAFVAEKVDWRLAYIVGGCLGLALLVLRISVFESGLFTKVKKSEKKRGDFFYLFRSKKVFFKYLNCIVIGMPIWYVIGILLTFSPEFSRALSVTDPISAGRAVMYGYMGLIAGDFASGALSQFLKSRRKAVLIFILFTLVSAVVFHELHEVGSTVFYLLCGLMGFGTGYWAVFVTIGAEQFGTNLRATVTTTVPNFVRGSVVPVTFLFVQLKGRVGILTAGLSIGIILSALALLSLWKLEETFSKNLDYLESLS